MAGRRSRRTRTRRGCFRRWGPRTRVERFPDAGRRAIGVKARLRAADNYRMLGLLGVVYVVALVVVLKDRHDARRVRATTDLSRLPAEDRPPLTAPTTPVPTSWVGIYVEEGIEALSAFLARRDHGSTP